MDLDVHGLASALWRDDNFFNHAAQALEDEIARLAFPQTFQMHAQLFDELAVAICCGRVENDRLIIGFEGFGFCAQLSAFGLHFTQAIKHPVSRTAFDKQVDEFLDLLVEFGQSIGDGLELAGLIGRKLAAFEMVVRDVGGVHSGIGQVGIEGAEHALFHMCPCDRAAVVAITALAIAGAADAVVTLTAWLTAFPLFASVRRVA